MQSISKPLISKSWTEPAKAKELVKEVEVEEFKDGRDRDLRDSTSNSDEPSSSPTREVTLPSIIFQSISLYFMILFFFS